MNSKPKTQKPPIDDFNGYYEFLNNDFPSWIEFEGLFYPNVSTAFQAARTSNQQTRKKITELQNYEDFKQLVSSIKNPEGWYQNRYKVMEKLIRDKFKRNRQIANKLVSTDERKLINCYQASGENQLYWGAVKQKKDGQKDKFQYRGNNALGKILQMVRADIAKMTDNQKWIAFQNLQEDEQLFPETALIVIKDSQPIDKLLLEKRNNFVFGSHPKCQFKLQHPSISKFHAVIIFSELQVLIIDLNSTHGTFILKKGQKQKQKLQPLHKRGLEDGDTIIFGLSSRTYACSLKFDKVQAALKQKQQEASRNVNGLGQVNRITIGMDKEEIKSKMGYKKYQGIYVKNINRAYSYNDIKELFRKFGPIEKIRLIQNYKNSKFQGEVIIIYDFKLKIQDVLRDIKKSQDKEISSFELIPVDKYDIEKILSKNKQDRSQNRQKDRTQGGSKFEQIRREKQGREDRRRSRSRQKERKEKHKKYGKDY